MSDTTDVDRDALLAFGQRMLDHLQGGPDHPGYAVTVSEVGPTLGAVRLGSSGMREAAYAGSSHAAAADAVGQFVRDTCDGVLALAYVAAQVAEVYRAGDAEHADQMAAVTAAFTPAPGQQSIASQHAAEAAAGAVAALRALFLGDPQVPAAPVAAVPPVGPAATGGSTVDHGPGDPQEPASSRYTRYVDQVETHGAFVSDGGHGSAEDDYDPRAEYDNAVEEARRRSEEDHIPYEVVVDDHGSSQVVQSDPDDIPHRTPVDYTDAGRTAPAYPVGGG